MLGGYEYHDTVLALLLLEGLIALEDRKLSKVFSCFAHVHTVTRGHMYTCWLIR